MPRFFLMTEFAYSWPIHKHLSHAEQKHTLSRPAERDRQAVGFRMSQEGVCFFTKCISPQNTADQLSKAEITK